MSFLHLETINHSSQPSFIIGITTASNQILSKIINCLINSATTSVVPHCTLQNCINWSYCWWIIDHHHHQSPQSSSSSSLSPSSKPFPVTMQSFQPINFKIIANLFQINLQMCLFLRFQSCIYCFSYWWIIDGNVNLIYHPSLALPLLPLLHCFGPKNPFFGPKIRFSARKSVFLYGDIFTDRHG